MIGAKRKPRAIPRDPRVAGWPCRQRSAWRWGLVLLALLCLHPASAAQIFLRVNQLGYAPADVKLGIAFSESPLPATFSVLRPDGGTRVFAGESHPVTGSSWGRFPYHAELDFTALKTPGGYRLRLGEAESLPWVIDAKAGAGLPDLLLQFMRQQRCGYNPWLEAECHTRDGHPVYSPQTNLTTLDATGGWHDAADLLKYLLTSGNATAQMLLAFQLSGEPATTSATGRPHWLADAVNARGQPGPNGIPDLLDEARWGLGWMLKLHPAPDQLYHQVADDRDHAGRRLPQKETVDYGWGKGGARPVYYADGKPQGLRRYQSQSTGIANLAGRYAAAMALAWQTWHAVPAHRPFAERCLTAGREVYALGRAQEGVQQGNSFGAPYRYEETTWADDMEWGAAELFRATGDPRFRNEAQHYARLAAAESWMGKTRTGHYQYYPFINLGHYRLYDLVDRDGQRELAGYYREGLARCASAGEKNPYRLGVPFIWCSNNLLTALATQCLLYERMTGDRQFRSFAACQRDWLLGRNPWGYAMFTGIGSAWPRHPHLMTSALTGRAVVGGLVDGPVYRDIFQSLKGVTITEPDPLAPFQGEAVYHDDEQDYSSNEPTMDGTASAILLWVVCGTQAP